jgi:D-alanyl-D-alanine-carboxypeptidase/D-alanyl-D-alanine-endopeptidase
VSFLARDRSTAERLRDGDGVIAERFGPLHRDAPMLEWGSITKTVTAAIAARLANARELDLDAPVATVLPATLLPDAVTVRSLVDHTSGLPRVPTGMGDVFDPYAAFTTERFDLQVVPTLAAERREPKPTPDYSNLGYAVLTRVLEEATGERWWELARARVLEPLGVVDVDVDPPADRRPVVRGWNGSPRAPWTMRTGPFVGAGGLWGTFDALERYATAAARHIGPDAWAPGWQVAGAVRWHNGHVRDSGSFVAVDTASDRVVTVHTLGRFVGTADRVARRLMRRHRRDPA